MPGIDQNDYAARLSQLVEKKLAYTKEKQEVLGYMDYDDHGILLPPPQYRKLVQVISGSGMPITDCIFSHFQAVSNHPDGSFYGARAMGENYRELMYIHPTYVDPLSDLAGAYMTSFNSYHNVWSPDFPYDHLKERQDKYQLVTGIGAPNHFAQDNAIGFSIGWDGIRAKIHQYRPIHPESGELYDGLEAILDGVQNWIERTAREALAMSERESDPQVAAHLKKLYEINMKVAHQAPESYWEACQLLLWIQIFNKMYNTSGSLGRLDALLQPFYEADVEKGILDDEKAIFLLCCYFIRDTSYVQLGGYGPDGRDTTCKMSYLVLEAIHRLKIPANAGVSVGKGIDRGLLRKGVEFQFADKCGNPRFLGVDSLSAGFARNGGMDLPTARTRVNTGCHWMGVPGREYSLMDCVKVNMAVCFDLALRESVAEYGEPSVQQIYDRYLYHTLEAVKTLAEGFDFHFDHMHKVCPELPLDLMCYGTIEKGLDASNGGVEFYYFCVDASGLAIVADSFAAIEQRVIKEKRYSFRQLIDLLDSDWAGPEGEKARLFFKGVDRYGKGGSLADEYAVKLSQDFTRQVKEVRSPKHGFEMNPGIFSWANTIPMGKFLGATPDGRHKGQPISHGANPSPGFRQDGAATAMSNAIAAVQCGYGNTAPLQIEMEPTLSVEEGGVELIMALIEDHFARGGTLINMNVIDADRVIQAHQDPSKYPDLVVRVTGFSAYFASLSPEFRQLVVDRILDKTKS